MAYNLICTGNITSNGGSNITSEGFYYGLTTSVEIGYIPSTTLVQSGNFTGTITGLLEGTTYYIKSFAINSVGTSITTDYIQQKTLGTSIKADKGELRILNTSFVSTRTKNCETFPSQKKLKEKPEI